MNTAISLNTLLTEILSEKNEEQFADSLMDAKEQEIRKYYAQFLLMHISWKFHLHCIDVMFLLQDHRAFIIDTNFEDDLRPIILIAYYEYLHLGNTQKHTITKIKELLHTTKQKNKHRKFLLLCLGRFYAQEQDFKNAHKFLKKYLHVNKCFWDYNELANNYLKLGDKTNAKINYIFTMEFIEVNSDENEDPFKVTVPDIDEILYKGYVGNNRDVAFLDYMFKTIAAL